MRHRAIGDTEVPVVGVGNLDVSIAHGRGLTTNDVRRALDEALSHGVTLVEASEPEAEKLCGDAIRGLRLRDKAIAITHVPPVSRSPKSNLAHLPPLHVQTCVEVTLRATRFEVLSLAMLPLSATVTSRAWPELAGTCARLVREGKVLRWGALLELPDDRDTCDRELEAAAKLAEPFVALSITFSACDRRALPLLAGELPVFARTPFAGGALAGALGPGMRLGGHDERKAIDAGTLERIAAGLARLSPLVRDVPAAARSCDAGREILERDPRRDDIEVTDVAELALRYAIDRGAIAMPRLHRAEHVAGAIAAATASPLPSTTLDDIERLLESR